MRWQCDLEPCLHAGAASTPAFGAASTPAFGASPGGAFGKRNKTSLVR